MSDNGKRRNLDSAWEALDAHYGILSAIDKQGVFELSAADIHEMRRAYPAVKFEPRLLTHFDNQLQQPHFFNANGLSILPVKRGTYVIGRFDLFKKIDSYVDMETVRLPMRPIPLESAYVGLRSNEEMGLNHAYNMGILADFAGEDLYPTVWGRHSSGCWDYEVKMGDGGGFYTLSARDSQIEVDGGFEGRNGLILIEAKNNLVKEFCLRQLYFPFRAWANRIAKPVRSVFAAIDGDAFYLFEYAFINPRVLDAKLVKSRKYIIDTTLITRDQIKRIHDETPISHEPREVPFPQANTPAIMIDVALYINEKGECSKDEIAEYVGFDPRQSDYYGNALRYFGLATRKYDTRGPFILTREGKHFCGADQDARKLMLLQALMSREKFRIAYEEYLRTREIPSESFAMGLVRDADSRLDEVTVHRRASTIRNWVRWMVEVPCA